MRLHLWLAAICLLLIPISAVARVAESEAEVGKTFDEKFCKENKLVQDQAMLDRVNNIGQALVKVSERPELKYIFRVYVSDEPNASTVAGGYIYVTTALMKLCNTDSELAAVMSHEVAHCSLGHGMTIRSQIKEMSRTAKIMDILTDGEASAMACLKMLEFSRAQEVEADSHGFQYLKKANFDPVGAVGIYSWLLEQDMKSNEEHVTALESHPEPIRRYAYYYNEVVKPVLGAAEAKYGLPITQVRIFVSKEGPLANKLPGWALDAVKSQIPKDFGPKVMVIDGAPKESPKDSFKGELIYHIKLVAGEQPTGTLNLSLMNWHLCPFDEKPLSQIPFLDWIKLDDPQFDSKLRTSIENLSASFFREIKLNKDLIPLGMVVRLNNTQAKEYVTRISWRSNSAKKLCSKYYVLRPQKGVIGAVKMKSETTLTLERGELAVGDLLIVNYAN